LGRYATAIFGFTAELEANRLVGRADIVSRLAGLLPRQRFLTIVASVA
jgi:hypothetical protein